MTTYFVSGATGFLGSHIVSSLVDRGEQVVALVRKDSSLSRLPKIDNLHFAYISETGEVLSHGERETHEKSVFIHCAWAGVSGLKRNEIFQLDNIALTLKLLDFADSQGVKHFVGVGSQAEYGPKNGAVSELEVLQPTHLYGHAKAATFHAAFAYSLAKKIEFSWARIFSIYGPNDGPDWLISKAIDSFAKEQSLKLTRGEQLWDYLFVEDAVSAIISIADLPKGIGPVNVGSGQTVVIKDLVLKIHKLMGVKSDVDFGQEEYRSDQVMHLEADIGKITRMTGWLPSTSLEDGLRSTIESRDSRKVNFG